jgi:hypothetical protein
MQEVVDKWAFYKKVQCCRGKNEQFIVAKMIINLPDLVFSP